MSKIAIFSVSVVLLLAFAHGANAEEQAKKGVSNPVLEQQFAEDLTHRNGWRFDWHGYARMPVRFLDKPLGARGPYLVDDNYAQSGFAYLRVNETEWVELALSAQRENTRFVAGIFAPTL